MHPFAKKSFNLFKENYLNKFNNPKIVDLGSLDVNGSIKNEIDFKCDYVGVDVSKGKNVDIVLDNPYILPFEDNTIDIVSSISTFEHVDFFWEIFKEILRILKPKGLFFLNVPSNGPFHRHPNDNWRFYPDAGLTLKKWGEKNGFEPELLESFVHDYSGREGTNDFLAVMLKSIKYEKEFDKRILDQFKNFRNGRTNRNNEIINFKRLTQDQDNWGWKLFFKFNKLLHKLNIRSYKK